MGQQASCTAPTCYAVRVADPRLDTVKISPPFDGVKVKSTGGGTAFTQKLQEAHWRDVPHVKEEELRRAEAAAEAAALAMESARRREEQRLHAQRRADAERLRKAEESRLADAERKCLVEDSGAQADELAREKCRADEASKLKLTLEDEAERTQKRRAQQEHERVVTFLKANGFCSVTARRRRIFKVSYPLHAAVKRNDAEMVQLLLRAMADPTQKGSSGLTPLQLAQKRDKRGSHTAVLSAFGVPPAK